MPPKVLNSTHLTRDYELFARKREMDPEVLARLASWRAGEGSSPDLETRTREPACRAKNYL